MKRIFVLCLIASSMLAFGFAPIANNVLFAQDDSATQEDDKRTSAELVQEGRSLMGDADWSEAAKVFQRAVDQDANNGEAWHYLGYCLHMDGNLEAAMKAHAKAATFETFRVLGNYNMACAHSLQENADKSFEYLNKAIEAGFRDLDQLEGDGDFDNVRDDARYAKAVALIKNDGKAPEKMDDKKEDTKKKSPSLIGDWKVVSGVIMGREGELLPESITVTKEKITIPTPEAVFLFSYKIDDSKKPIEIDMTIEEGPQPGAEAKGIIKFDGEKATLCYHPMGGDRPDDFKSTEENQVHLFVMEKAAKADAGSPPKAAAPPDPASLIGSWKYNAGWRGGEKVEQDRLESVVTIDKENITLPAGEDAFVMSYKIDSSKTPWQVDMKVVSGPAPEGSAAIGILRMSGDTFLLCYDPTGAKRPENFESSHDNQFFMFELKKVVID